MPTAQELSEALNAQIAEVKQAECKVEEAWLWAEEEARVAMEQARRAEEEEREWERVCLAEEARVWAEEARGGGAARSRAEPQRGGGVFPEEGPTLMTIPVVVGVCRKSRGEGEGGQPTQKQRQGHRSRRWTLGRSQGLYVTSVKRRELLAGGAR